MKYLKIGIIMSIIILFIILISGCSDAGTKYLLDGTWNLSTSNSVGGNVGSGTFTQTYSYSMYYFWYSSWDADYYTGSGSLSGGVIDGPYTVEGTDFVGGGGGVVVFLFSDGSDLEGDGVDDHLRFRGTNSGNRVTGTYSGWFSGAFADYSGDFTATKQ